MAAVAELAPRDERGGGVVAGPERRLVEPHGHEVGEQAHKDLERGLQDTDRRGGAEYQERTQTGGRADQGSKRKP